MDQPAGNKLRVHIVTQDDPLYVPHFFFEFFRIIQGQPIEITGVDITPPLNQESKLAAIKKAVQMFGLTGTARLGFRQVWLSLLDKLAPLSMFDRSLARQCRKLGLPLTVAPRINARLERDRIKALEPDVLLSVAASQVFKPRLLKIPARYALNVHNGKLPRYRGMMPVFWQLLEGRDAVTITVHTMDEKLDTGLIALERPVDVSNEWSLDKILRLCKVEAAHAVLDALLLVQNRLIDPQPQPSEGAHYFSFPTAKDAQELRDKGYSTP